MTEEKPPRQMHENRCCGLARPSFSQDSRISKMKKYFSPHNQQNTTLPSNLKWNTLKALFDDPDGVQLFNQYIQTKEALWDIAKSSYLNFLHSDMCAQHIREKTVDGMNISRIYIDENVCRSHLPLPMTDQDSHSSNKTENSSIHNYFDSQNISTLLRLKWNTLKGLLDDPDGSQLFNRYVQTEEALWIITKTNFHNFFQSDIYHQHVEKPIVKVERKRADGCEKGVRPPTLGSSTRTVLAVANLKSRDKKFDADQNSIAISVDNNPFERNKLFRKTRNSEPMNIIASGPPQFVRSQPRPLKTEHCSDKFLSEIIPKLEVISRQQQLEEKANQLSKQTRSTNDSTIAPNESSDIVSVAEMQVQDDNEQSILDQHVSRTIPAANRQCTNDSALDEDSPILRRNSRIKRISNFWSSVDSGINSKYSTLRSRSSRSTVADSTLKLTELPKPTLPSSTSTESTVVVYNYANEDLPYRSKLPGSMPTLGQLKEYLPKRGNFRFFFKTTWDDAENPVIQEEIVNDDEILPLFFGKVMAFIKDCE